MISCDLGLKNAWTSWQRTHLFKSDTSKEGPPCCERSFALMNRIHTYLRNRLGVATLNNLMCICSLGPSIMNFDPKLILAKWLEAPFMQKNGRGRSLQGKLNALMGAGSS